MYDLLSDYESLILSHFAKEYNVVGDRQTLRLQITFTNGSVLIAHQSFFYDTSRFKYAYQWQTADNKLIRRWDNAHAVDVPTSPDYQHIGTQENIVAPEPMTLEKVLTFIASQLISS